MKNYLSLLEEIINKGEQTKGRNGTTYRLFGRQLRFDLTQGFPLMTTKSIHLPSVVYELLWFLKGESNIAYLKQNKVSIWDEWADENGELGPVYGVQWRAWDGGDGKKHDQIQRLINDLQNNPFSRRHILNAWNVSKIDEMKLPPCHLLAQFFVSKDKKLSCQLYQRSADFFLGVPFNIASYSLLTHLLAHQCALGVGEFIITFGDVHLYDNHLKAAQTQLKRKPYPKASLKIKTQRDYIEDYEWDDFEFANYQHHPKISAPVSA